MARSVNLPPGTGHNLPHPTEHQAIVEAFTDILLTPRSADTPCFLDTAFQKAELMRCNQAPPDPLLTDLFLFREGRMPRHTNLFNADLGVLSEKLITTLFEMTRGSTINASDSSMVALEAEAEQLRETWEKNQGSSGKFPKWKKADFLMGVSHIVECKYRFNSYDAKQKQIKIALLYKAMGLTPVFLHLSPDFAYTDEFIAAGWEVYTGKAMIEYVLEHTGYDLKELLQQVSAQPVVRKRLMDAHDSLIEDQKAGLWSEYRFAPEEVRSHFVEKFSECETSMSSLADRIETHPPLEPDIVSESLRDRTERLCNETTQTLPQEKRDALLGILLTLEEDQRAELLSEALSKSSDRTQMTVMSVFG